MKSVYEIIHKIANNDDCISNTVQDVVIVAKEREKMRKIKLCLCTSGNIHAV